MKHRRIARHRSIGTTSPVESASQRAARYRRRGDHRRALLALREAAYTDEHSAKLWVLYGAQCVRANKLDAAREAFNHAAWVHERARHPAKAAVTRRLLTAIRRPRAA